MSENRTGDAVRAPLASVVVPAHDEARTIARTLRRLREGTAPGELEVVVVCNGCTDDTAAVARAADPAALVLEVPEPSKVGAVRVGNQHARTFPRVHLDADVEITGESVRALVSALGDGVLAAGPRRVVPRQGCAPVVRWYYDVWERLPAVRDGLFGRGVVALAEEGQRRVERGPELMSDDLGISEAFEPAERVVVEAAEVVVHPPRTVADLLRRRQRVVTGNVQAGGAGVRRDSSRTGSATLVELVRRQPRTAPKVAVFAMVGMAARVRARRAVRRGDFTTWARDESSRSGGQ